MNTTPPVQRVLEILTARGHNPRQTSRGWEARCVAHDDRMPSLGVGQGERGDCLLKCAAGCTLEQITAALGLTLKDLFMPAEPVEKKPRKPRKVHATLDAAIGAAAWAIAKRLDIPQEQLTPAGRWDYQNADGQLVAAVIRHDLPSVGTDKPSKQFTPLHAGGDGWVLGDPKGKWPLYHLPAVLAAAGKTIYLTEGEKAAEAITSLGLVCTCTAHGAKSPQMTDLTPLASVSELIILPDNDDAGRAYAAIVANMAMARAPLLHVRIVELPDLPAKGDAVEYLEARSYLDPAEIRTQLEALIAAAPILAAPAPGSDTAPTVQLPEVQLTCTHEAVEECLPILSKDQNLFQRTGSLVRTVRTEPILLTDVKTYRPAGSLIIQEMTSDQLRHRLACQVLLTKYCARADEWQHAHPPEWLVNEILTLRDWPQIPCLRGVSDAPVLRPDGSIWQTPGYDPQTGVYYQPPDQTSFPPIPEKPTLEQAQAALAELAEVVCDFPFERPEHYAAWIAALLTPLAMFTFNDPAPLFLMDANIRGAGKTRLAKLISRIITGRDMAVNVYAHESEEFKKVVTGVALAGDRMILLDNVSGPFGNAALETLTTSRTWQGRLLGQNANPTFEMSTVWFASGNNVQPVGDTCRRLIPIRLNYITDDTPEQRTSFRHPHLLDWTTENRPRLLAAALTVLSAFLPLRETFQGPTPIGSFEGWSRTVRNCCIWLGLTDPYLAQSRMAEMTDTDGESLSQLLAAWNAYAAPWPKDRNGWLHLSEIILHLYKSKEEDLDTKEDRAMRSAVDLIAAGKEGRAPTSQKLGKVLEKFRNRPKKGLMLVKSEVRTELGRAWKVISTTPINGTENGTFPNKTLMTMTINDDVSAPSREKWQSASQDVNGTPSVLPSELPNLLAERQTSSVIVNRQCESFDESLPLSDTEEGVL